MKDDIYNHPLENLFNIENGSTDLEPYANLPIETRKTDLVKIPELYDNKDQEIEEQFQEIYDYAISAYENQAKEIQHVEPKYRARNHEMAIQYLNTALQAAKEKSGVKANKDKLNIDKQKLEKKTSTTNNNLIIGNRNDILKMLRSIDVDPLEEKVVNKDDK